MPRTNTIHNLRRSVAKKKPSTTPRKPKPFRVKIFVIDIQLGARRLHGRIPVKYFEVTPELNYPIKESQWKKTVRQLPHVTIDDIKKLPEFKRDPSCTKVLINHDNYYQDLFGLSA